MSRARPHSSRPAGARCAVHASWSASAAPPACTGRRSQASEGDIERVDELAGRCFGAPTKGTVENFLLVGSDSRAGIDADSEDAGLSLDRHRTDDGSAPQRHDHDPAPRPGQRRASLLSASRATCGCRSPAPATSGKHQLRRTTTGPRRLVETITQALGIPIHHYVEVDFSGFKRSSTRSAACEICVDYADPRHQHRARAPEPGCQILDGVAGARLCPQSRHYEEFRDGEWQRGPARPTSAASSASSSSSDLAPTAALERDQGRPVRARRLVDAAIGPSLRVDDDARPCRDAGARCCAGRRRRHRHVLAAGRRQDDRRQQSALLLGDGADAVLAYFRGDGPRHRSRADRLEPAEPPILCARR